MTRISSVFNLLKRVGFAVLLLGVAIAYAQPMPEVIWERDGLEANNYFGGRISWLGDQNDDGFEDWMVSAYGGHTYVELFHGGNPPSTEPYRRFTTGDTVYAVLYGEGIGDINGDGIQDYQIILWPEFDGDLTTLIYWGGEDQDTLPDYIRQSGFGDRFERLGDFNGDGFDDLFFGTFSGYGQIMFGGDPFDLEPDWIVHDDPPGSQSSFPLSYGDINGDGFADVLSSYGVGGQKVWFGSLDPDTVPQAVSDLHITGIRELVNDMNGDGRAEFLVPHPQSIDFYFGSESLSASPDYILQWPMFCTPGDLFSAGDFNRDGANDLMAIGYTCLSGSGLFGMYLGYHWINPWPVFEVWGYDFDLVGIKTACALGDVNGDGIDDVAIGAYTDDFEGNRGRVVMFAGSEEFVVPAEDQRPVLPQELSISVYPNPFNAETTIDFHLPLFVTEVELRVFNTLGQQVKQLSITANAPQLTFHFNAADLPTGVYFLRARAGQASNSQKLMVLR